MKVFLSWSGERSGKVAGALHDWLPNVIQSVSPFVSATDIEKGTRWANEIASQLDETDYGLICLTQENLQAPWLLFESGALSKSIGHSRVTPYLFHVSLSQLEGPLTQFQASTANKDSTWETVQSINNAAEGSGLESARLKRSFEAWWPQLEKSLRDIPETTRDAAPDRDERQILEEILETVRQISRQSSEDLPEIKSMLRLARNDVAHGIAMPHVRRFGGATETSDRPSSSYENLVRIIQNLPGASQPSEDIGRPPEDDERG